MAKTQEEIAFELLSKLKGLGVWGEGNKNEILDLYAECLIATQGRRRVKGLKAAQAAPVTEPGFKQAQPFVPPVQAPQVAPAQVQAPQVQAPNPVQQQQQQVAQAYQPPQQQVAQG